MIYVCSGTRKCAKCVYNGILHFAFYPRSRNNRRKQWDLTAMPKRPALVATIQDRVLKMAPLHVMAKPWHTILGYTYLDITTFFCVFLSLSAYKILQQAAGRKTSVKSNMIVQSKACHKGDQTWWRGMIGFIIYSVSNCVQTKGGNVWYSQC